jgi:hypothetical protein
MLAAASSAFGNLESIRLLLSLASSDPAQIPAPLLSDAKVIIQQAQAIMKNPKSIDSSTRPEAIALAYAMGASVDLSTDIGRLLTESQGINQAIAGDTLQHLDAAFVA